jgi:hypothetical protein
MMLMTDFVKDYCRVISKHVTIRGLVVIVLARGSKIRGFKPGRQRWTFLKGDKNPQHDFLRRGSKAFGNIS